jgi:hypothetical protein
MIVVRLRGGLGNQMFQFSAGMALALKYSVPLYADITRLKQDLGKEYTNRKLELHQFQTNLVFPDEKILSFYSRTCIEKMFGLKAKYKTLTEGDEVSKDFFIVKPPLLLDGFWQSEKYFNLHREALVEVFQPAYDLECESKGWLDKIESTRSVSIHIRRGDYVNLKSAADFHGVLALDYYQTAVRILQEQYFDLNFFVFSDDLTWCRDVFRSLNNFHFVDTNSDKSSLDLLLMSRCNHNIIANSSFSWWGSWLNSYPEKQVIAPKNWFKNKIVNSGMIYCDSWKII